MHATGAWRMALVVLVAVMGGTASAQPASGSPSERRADDAPGKNKAKPKNTRAKPEPGSRRERLRRAKQRIRKAQQRSARQGKARGRPGAGKGPRGKPMRHMKRGGRAAPRARSDAGRGWGRRGMGRRQAWRRLRRHWPRNVVSPALTAEMRRHARRMAKLFRIGDLARKEDDQKAVERVEALMARERARHRHKIEVLSAAVQGDAPKPSSDESKEGR